MITLSEDAIQKEIVAYLRAVLPDAIIHHSPNGGKRSKAQAGLFKALGVVAGFPDIIILRRSTARFFEVKTEAGVLSAPQKAFRDWCIANGFQWAVVRSVEQARTALEFWGVETREAA